MGAAERMATRSAYRRASANTATNGPDSVTDDRQAARARLAAQRRQRDASRLLEELAPLSGPRGYYTRRSLAGAA